MEDKRARYFFLG